MRYSTAALLLTAITTTLAAPTAWACMDFEALSPTESSQLLAAAEKQLEDGQPQAVIDLLAYTPEMSSWRHGNKRMELVAIASIRVGKVDRGVRALRALLRKAPDDPFLLARLAEGLGRSKNGKAEALAILERLDREDLMPDAKGYAVLAQLLPAGKGASQAAARCEQRALKKSDCTLGS